MDTTKLLHFAARLADQMSEAFSDEAVIEDIVIVLDITENSGPEMETHISTGGTDARMYARRALLLEGVDAIDRQYKTTVEDYDE